MLGLAHDSEVWAGVRCAASAVLGELGRAEEARGILLGLVFDPAVGDSIRMTSVSFLGDLARTDEKALGGLLALARDEKVDDGVRSAAYQSLKRLAGGVGVKREA